MSMSFQEFAKQRKRMCTNRYCMDCPLNSLKITKERGPCFVECLQKPEEAESIVAKWAAENPELVYPTWEEWQKETFPDARLSMYPCCFGPCKRFDDGSNDCGLCVERPIPADIAEQLGVKPRVKES